MGRRDDGSGGGSGGGGGGDNPPQLGGGGGVPCVDPTLHPQSKHTHASDSQTAHIKPCPPFMVPHPFGYYPCVAHLHGILCGTPVARSHRYTVAPMAPARQPLGRCARARTRAVHSCRTIVHCPVGRGQKMMGASQHIQPQGPACGKESAENTTENQTGQRQREVDLSVSLVLFGIVVATFSANNYTHQ